MVALVVEPMSIERIRMEHESDLELQDLKVRLGPGKEWQIGSTSLKVGL
jgi:hypothetical protein